MKRWLSGFVALVAVSILPAVGHAQSRIGSYQRPVVNPNPTFSPYLNLARGAGGGVASTAIDYYGIVRPQLDLRTDVTTMQQQLQGLQTQQSTQTGETDPGAPATGRTIGGFLNYSHYFPQFTHGSGSSRTVPAGYAGQR